MSCSREDWVLFMVQVDGCTLEKCRRCKGLWLDRGQFKKVCKIGRRGLEDSLCLVSGGDVDESHAAEGYMRCPKCLEGRLQTITYTLTRPVKIDRCDRCLGVWVDHFELDAIIAEKARLEFYDAQVDAARYHQAEQSE